MSRDASFRCSVCGPSELTALRAYRGSAPGFEGKTLARCRGCGLVTMHPPPSEDELASYYDSYWEDRSAGRQLDKLAARAGARVRFLGPHLPDRDPLRVVDAGAGLGQMYSALREMRPDRELEYDAVEVDPEALRHLSDVLRVRAVRSRIEDCPGPYDLLVMSHFLEHLCDPVAYLRSQRPRLERGGLIFVEVPNADYRFKDHDQPHLCFFTTDTLTAVVESAGFEVLRIDTCGAPTSQVGTAKSGKSWKPGQRRGPWRRAKKAWREWRRARNPERARAKPDPHLESYGGDRRWIRVAAAMGAG
jgi:SAM-dependent methyltransferase